MSGGLLNLNWAWAIVDAFVQQGGCHVVLSPGSRSTPLALAAHRHPGVSVHVVVDERSAAFFALGVARRTEMPVALICTSGTAAANYHPAMAEAAVWGVPLMALTADRPPRLRGVGAAQTIDQNHLFGLAVSCIDLPLPQETALAAMRLRISLAFRESCAFAPAPLHVNVSFDEPLAPDTLELAQWAPPNVTGPRVSEIFVHADPEPVTQLAQHIHQSARPLLLAGPGAGDRHAARSILRWAAQTGVPVVADAGSGLRGAPSDATLWVHADLYLRGEDLAALAPDLIITVGRAFTSKAIATWLASQTAPVVAIWPDHKGRDPDASVAEVLIGHVGSVFDRLLDSPPPSIEPDWLDGWRACERRVMALTQRVTPGLPAEAAAVKAAITAMPQEGCLVLSNSLPVRHADSYAGNFPQDVVCLTIRGANGIDGLNSFALGAARGGMRPTLLITGDLAFLHDVGALALAWHFAVPLVILVLDNGGGGIFHHLPVAASVPEFETLFGTPHHQDLGKVAQGFGVRVLQAASAPAVGYAVGEALAQPGVTVIIFHADRNQTVVEHRQFVAAAAVARGDDA